MQQMLASVDRVAMGQVNEAGAVADRVAGVDTLD
jgi:hypothetical protein